MTPTEEPADMGGGGGEEQHDTTSHPAGKLVDVDLHSAYLGAGSLYQVSPAVSVYPNSQAPSCTPIKYQSTRVVYKVKYQPRLFTQP